MFCKDCKHFRQHYVKRGRSWYMAIHDGHCIYPRLKPRKTDTPACEHFKARPISEEAEA